MADIVISCRMFENELTQAMKETGTDAPVVWMEKGLHTNPDNLRCRLQEMIEESEEKYAPAHILLAYGFCGNAMQGLAAKKSVLVLPRIDDCITMFIGSRERKAALEEGVGTIYQTTHRSDGEDTLLDQRNGFVEEYGEEDGQEVFDMIYGHYHRLAVLDTRCFPLEEVVRESRNVAEQLGFEHRVYDATNDFLVDLLSGQWSEERFIVKKAGEAIDGKDLHV